MKKEYMTPIAKKVKFDFNESVVASDCGSGIFLKNQPGTQCGTHTPDQLFGRVSTYAFEVDPNTCGWQSGPA